MTRIAIFGLALFVVLTQVSAYVIYITVGLGKAFVIGLPKVAQRCLR